MILIFALMLASAAQIQTALEMDIVCEGRASVIRIGPETDVLSIFFLNLGTIREYIRNIRHPGARRRDISRMEQGIPTPFVPRTHPRQGLHAGAAPSESSSRMQQEHRHALRSAVSRAGGQPSL